MLCAWWEGDVMIMIGARYALLCLFGSTKTVLTGSKPIQVQ